MPSIRAAVLILSLATATHAVAAEPATRYLELSNRAHDSLTALAIAEPGGKVFRDVPLGAPVRGGGDATTLRLSGDSCRYDLRFTFRNGRSMIYRDVDVCAHRVSIRPLPRLQAGERDVQVADAVRTSP